MSELLPEGENLRRAVKWISDGRQDDPERPVQKLVQEATLRFDLSPRDGEFLHEFFRKEVSS